MRSSSSEMTKVCSSRNALKGGEEDSSVRSFMSVDLESTTCQTGKRILRILCVLAIESQCEVKIERREDDSLVIGLGLL